MAKKDVYSKVTNVKVAERAGVSLGTVARVLNNDIHAAPDARERVSAVMGKLGYAANLVKGTVDGLLFILTNTSFPLVFIDQTRYRQPLSGCRRAAWNAGRRTWCS